MSAHKGVITVESQEVPDLPLTNAVFDPVGDTMLCTFGPSKEFRSVEIQQISVSVAIAFLVERYPSGLLGLFPRILRTVQFSTS